MRTKSLSFVLIISFLISSFPTAFAQEAVPTEPLAPEAEPVVNEEPELPIVEPVEASEKEEAPAQSEPEPSELPEAALPPEPEYTADTEPAVQQVSALEEPALLEAPVRSVSLLIRYGENVAWSGDVELPDGGTVTATPTGESGEVEIAADGLLAVLMGVDASSDAFAITDLDYYPSFGSFIVNCITLTGLDETCSQWQYVIDGQYPFIGIDDYVLEDGDEVFIYFGSPRRVVLADTDIVIHEDFTATAQSYDPETNNYSPLPGYTIGITQPNPANPFSPLEIATSTSGTDGTSMFSLASEGAYGIGLQEDFYFPSVSFTVSSTSDSGTGPGSEQGGGFDVAAAYRFLAIGQEEDGSWNEDFITDWIAIALGVSGAPSSMKSDLVRYLKEEEPDELESARDYERHAMALMALNINPYTGGPSDYITPIVESFDGEQIDEPGIVNDDAFALITLMHAGYTKDDEIIKKVTAFIVDEQHSDGSWDGGVDLSGPYVQALSQVRSLPGVSSALSRAEAYMRSSQNPDGGFGSPSDPFATSWTLQGIEALGNSAASWSVGENIPLTYLTEQQEEDGGMNTGSDDYDNRAWATAYAIPAAKGLTWDDILHDFKKQVAESDEEEADANEGTATTTDEILTLLPREEPLIEPYVATSVGAATEERMSEAAETGTPKLTTVEEVPEESGVSVEHPASDLTAAAWDTGVWEKLKELLASFWSFLKSLF